MFSCRAGHATSQMSGASLTIFSFWVVFCICSNNFALFSTEVQLHYIQTMMNMKGVLNISGSQVNNINASLFTKY